MPVSDLDQAEAYLKRIRDLDFDILAPAHDVIVRDRRRIEEWIDDALSRCALMRRQTMELLAANPDMPLAALGKILCGGNKGITFFHKSMVAHTVVKAVERQTPSQ